MTDDDLAADLTATVRTVPGVVDVYPATPVLRTVVARAERALTGGTAVPVVRVEHGDDGTDVTVNVSVSIEVPTPTTLGAVSEAVVTALRTRGVTDGRVHVRAVRVCAPG